MISVIIRNKNEAEVLESILTVLSTVYADDIDEIIVVDNNSTDKSVEVAKKYNCKIVNIKQFTYGKAINLGIEHAKNNLVLLLSSHAVPVGNSFFKNSILEFTHNPSLAGMRYINSFTNYLRAEKNNFFVKDGLSYGLMAACAMVNKKVWNEFKFDEKLIASEDKEWSKRVINAGYKIKDFNETFFYHINRTEEGSLKRLKIETVAHYQLHDLQYPSFTKIIMIFAKKLFIDLPLDFFQKMIYEVKLLRLKFEIKKEITKNKE